MLPGVRLNVTKRGMSVSVGHRGCRYTTGTSGRRATLGLPGSGVYYTRRLGGSSRSAPPKPAPSALRTLIVLAVLIWFATAMYHGIMAAR